MRYQWQAVDTLTAGEHVAEFEITHAGGAVETVPNHGHETILISPDISAANFTFPPPVVPPLVPGYAYAVGFPSRAALVTWAAGATVVAGTVASAEGYAYRYLGMGTSIADLPGWIINGPAYAGDVTSPQDSLTLTIPANSVPNAKLATVATATIKGRATAGTGNVEDLTAAQAKAVLTITATDVAMSGGGTAQEYAGFATRASFVAWASGKAPAVGSVVDVAGRRYRYIGSGTAISDLAGWIPDSAAFLDMWPNTLAGFQEALTYCSGSTLFIAPGTYAYASAADNFFTPVDNTRIVGAGRGLVNITFTGSAAFWYVFRGANFFMDGCSVTLAFSADGQGYLYIMAVGNGARFLNNSLTVNYLFSAGVYVRQGSLMQIASGAATYDEIVIERETIWRASPTLFCAAIPRYPPRGALGSTPIGLFPPLKSRSVSMPQRGW